MIAVPLLVFGRRDQRRQRRAVASAFEGPVGCQRIRSVRVGRENAVGDSGRRVPPEVEQVRPRIADLLIIEHFTDGNEVGVEIGHVDSRDQPDVVRQRHVASLGRPYRPKHGICALAVPRSTERSPWTRRSPGR